METLKALESISYEAPVGDDEICEAIYEVELQGSWILTSEKVFHSWTGARRKNGDVFHGRIVPLGTDPINGPTYNGFRTCPCATCQGTVSPQFKMN